MTNEHGACFKTHIFPKIWCFVWTGDKTFDKFEGQPARKETTLDKVRATVPLTRALNVIKKSILKDVPSIPAAPQPESPPKNAPIIVVPKKKCTFTFPNVIKMGC
jgi:hypothetical protein